MHGNSNIKKLLITELRFLIYVYNCIYYIYYVYNYVIYKYVTRYLIKYIVFPFVGHKICSIFRYLLYL